jgi:uncharacterized Fe-S center protein
MANVYFKRFKGDSSPEIVKSLSRQLLAYTVNEEKIELEKEIPLKVHFGEKGNVTYIKPDNFDGVIDYLQDKNIKSSFIETTVLYGGQRYRKDLHLKTAVENGFTRIPVIIADGDHGESYTEIEINKNHFEKCKIAREFSKYSQLIVLAHFKGHGLSAFGGAIKQLAMGHAAKGGKLEMHLGIKPKIKCRKCEQCGLCQKKCAENAITIGDKSRIDPVLCVGCGACVAICPNKAVTVFTARGICNAVFGNRLKEKIVEYAYAAQKGKKNIYLNFLMNITRGCDCEGKKMTIIMDDIGILASTDPLAIDKASYDLVMKAGKKFRGFSTFAYAVKIGLGSADYILKEI